MAHLKEVVTSEAVTFNSGGGGANDVVLIVSIGVPFIFYRYFALILSTLIHNRVGLAAIKTGTAQISHVVRVFQIDLPTFDQLDHPGLDFSRFLMSQFTFCIADSVIKSFILGKVLIEKLKYVWCKTRS